MELNSPFNVSQQDSSSQKDDECYPEYYPNGVQELIANLDHELLDVRLRALKCLLGKIECGIVATEPLSQRIDLLNRLSDWLQTIAVDFQSRKSDSNSREKVPVITSLLSAQGIASVIELLLLLVEHESARKFIVEQKVDSSLSIIRLQLSGEIRVLIDRLLDLVHGKNFDFECEGSPDVWYDNTSSQSLGGLRKGNNNITSSVDDRDQQQSHHEENEHKKEHVLEEIYKNHNMTDSSDLTAVGGGDTYFPNQSTGSSINKAWASSGFNFGIPIVQLGPSDRRVLSSTIESILSKNDKLMLITACFVRDVLLQDYPAEVFIQESSLCMAMLEIAENSLNESNLQLVAAQTLLQLSSALRLRLVQLNCSEFFETRHLPPANIPSMRNNYFNDSTPYSFQTKASSSSIIPATNDTFVDIMCQIMKSLSRTLLFQQNDFNLWKLMESFALTLCKCVSIVPVDSKSLTLGLQEVLLDLAYCYEKNYENINSPTLALCLTSILKSIHVCDGTYILPNNVRQCLRKLLTCPQIIKSWPDVHKYVIKNTSGLNDVPHQSSFDGFESQYGDYGHNSKVVVVEEEITPHEVISKLLTAVQNSTSHDSVIQAVDSLWSYLLPLTINSRLQDGSLDYICKDVPWRDAFYRFLCVEPTCTEDETLFIKVIELLNFVITNMNVGKKELKAWIVPLCMEKGCASLRILNEGSLKIHSGVTLPNLLRSLFDFYFTLMRKSLNNVDNEFIWDLFSAFCLVLNELASRGFATPTVILHPLLKGVATLTINKAIKSQLIQNPKFCIALAHQVIEGIIYLQDQSGGGLSNESYRNQGVLYQASLSLYHLTLLLLQQNSNVTNDWVGKTCAVVPCFWESRDFKTRAVGFQLCELLTRRVIGVVAAMTILETPCAVWITSYNSLMDPEESALVKNKAACVLLNLINSWEELKENENINNLLQQLPNWSILSDFTKILAHVYWLPSLSEVFRTNDLDAMLQNDSVDETSLNTQLVTPKVLIVICKILMKMKTSSIPQFHPEPFVQSVISSGICPVLFRVIGTHAVSTTLQRAWWMDSCIALSSLVETLISMCQLDRCISIMLIGDKRSLASLIQLLILKPHAEKPQNQTEEILSALWANVFTLLSLLCADSGNNFEDLERCIRIQRNIIFERLVDWLKQDTLAKCRKVGLTFCQGLFSKMMQKHQEKEVAGHFNPNVEYTHPLLCQDWGEKQSAYGNILCGSLMNVYDDAINAEEKLCLLRTLTALINLSPATKTFAIEHDLIGLLMEKLTFSVKYYDSINTIPMGKKSLNQWQEEIVTILSLLSSITYRNSNAKKSALSNGVVDTCHKIFRLWKSYPDRSMLYGFIEALLNFTEEFPLGCQALTLTTNLLGVGPRKAPSQQSFLAEILEILHNEINGNENTINLKTIEIIFELLKNVMFVLECRNILVKSQILGFFMKLHVREMKKWGPKQTRIKTLYLDFILQISIHPDMQITIAKIPESVEILVLIIDLENIETSLRALKILRNLSFQPANRAKFLCDEAVLTALSAKIRDSDNVEEVEVASVGLWALINNSEKGKLLAKKALSHVSVTKAITRMRKLENSSHDLLTERRELTNLLNILSTLSTLLGPGFSASTNSVISSS